MKLEIIYDKDVIKGYLMRSPATNDMYCFYTKEGSPECYWEFNGDLEKPTFRPSMLNVATREHFFVTDGKIQYLSDCKHEMASQTVDMVEAWENNKNE